MTRTAELPPIPIGSGPRGRLVGAQRRKRLAVVTVLWFVGLEKRFELSVRGG